MDFGLSDDQQDIQRTARALLGERAAPERVRSHAEAGTGDDALWAELRELGWPGIAIAEQHGGQGLGCVELAILCEELGRSLAPVPLLPTFLATAVIEHGGDDAQCARWLPGLAAGEQTGALGLERDGAAPLVVGGAGADVLVLVDDGAGSARVLTREQATVTPVGAIDPTRPSASVAAPRGGGDLLAGDVAAGLDRARVAVAAELVGVCDRALSMTVAYVKERRQFGTPVGAYQAVSHRCAQMLLDTEQARAHVAHGAWAADADAAALPEAAALASAAASDAGREVTAGAIQAHGGIGFTWEADVHWLYKRAQVDAALLGGASRQRARIAALLRDRVAV